MQRGGLARRIFDEAPGKGVPPEEAAQMLRDYIAPSLDTTISTAAYLTWHFADSPDQWQLIREDKSLIGNAVEEVVRLTIPIRAFSRYVAEDVEMHGVSMERGSGCLSYMPAPIAMKRSFRMPKGLMSPARRTGIWGSARERICAWACIWHGWS